MAATPLDNLNRAGRMNNLALVLSWRFERTGDFDDLQHAIFQAEVAVAATAQNHPDRGSVISNPGHMLSSMPKLKGELHNCEHAIRSFTECVAHSSGT